MIEVHLASTCAARLQRELRRAGTNEIGGVLATERVGEKVFRIVDLSVQHKGGSYAAFSRDARLHHRFMRRFLDLTGHRYERFNYLGEWHSHPSFPALPSTRDVQMMYELLAAPDQKANFMVLLIVKLDVIGKLEASAHAFVRGLRPMRVPLVVEAGDGTMSEVAASPRLSLRKALLMRGEGEAPRPKQRKHRWI
jgi:[CysO sulfur-carrier protein]-S-L-cysteine hydrolase